MLRISCWFAIFSCALALIGCHATVHEPFAKALATGNQAYSAGHFTEAAQWYQKAAQNAKRSRDRVEALYTSAVAYERAQNTNQARRLLEQIAYESPPNERSMRALYKAALIELRHGSENRGYTMLERLIREEPDHGMAYRAFLKIVEHIEQKQSQLAAIRYAKALYSRVESLRLGEQICSEIGKRLEALGNAYAAIEQYLRCANRYPYPQGSLFDNTLWRASLLHEALGNFKAAIEALERIVAMHETSLWIGSYNRPLMSHAQMRIGELYRDRLHDHAAARKSFRRLYDEFKTSLLKPQALEAEGLLAHQDRDYDTACSIARTVLNEHSDTRYARRADAYCLSVAVETQRLRQQRADSRAKTKNKK